MCLTVCILRSVGVTFGSESTVCKDDDICLQKRPDWTEKYNCENSYTHPQWGCKGTNTRWSNDVRTCCHLSCGICTRQGGDLSTTIATTAVPTTIVGLTVRPDFSVGRGSEVSTSDRSSAVTIVVVVCITIILLTLLLLAAFFYSRLRKRGERSYDVEEMGDEHIQDGEVLETGSVRPERPTRSVYNKYITTKHI